MTTQTLPQASRRARRGAAREGGGAGRPSPLLVSLATRYFTRYVRRHFHAVRVLEGPPAVEGGAVIVYLNHASWWDPLTCMVLSRRYFPGRRHHAPIDAVALEKYKFLRKLGMFPLDRHSRAGAADFLRTAEGLLVDRETMLWITPEGHFTDPRTRPTAIRPGLAHLARRVPQVRLVPLAIEYTFWNERHPELLLTFGAPVALEERMSVDAATARLAGALEAAQDALAGAARAREAGRFTTLFGGRGGVHPVYDAFRRLAFSLRGKRFTANHEDTP